MKLWQKKTETAPEVEAFTIGKDQSLDLLLAPFDVIGSIAHAIMLHKTGLLEEDELEALKKELRKIYESVSKGTFVIGEHTEDIHSQVEEILTKQLGETGKKIHAGRSRNDQVLLDIKLFCRDKIRTTVFHTKKLFDLLIQLSDQYKNDLLPGYTHFQAAMPSSFGLWFGAYAESLTDDLIVLQAAYKVINRNPLGSGAGFGSSLPIDRELTTELLGFDTMNYNVVYAQMTRGKSEKIVSSALASIASTLSRMAMDICLYMGQDFGFISFPENLTTGSSIMPHKKNPDVFELVRARCNKLQSLPNELALICNNLPSGYHRDMQQIKESFLPAFDMLNTCLEIMSFMLTHIQIKNKILDAPRYNAIFSVEAVNTLVNNGIPFREAYRKTASDIAEGRFKKPENNLPLSHSHTGSMGNPANEKINALMEKIIDSFAFEKAAFAERNLIYGHA
jgi:argininosuccinate lyase